MAATVAQLVAQVSIQGAAQAKSELESVNTATKNTQSGFKSMLSGALSFATGTAIFNLAGRALGFLKDQMADVVTQALSQQAVMAQTNAVLKSTHDASGMTATAIGNFADQMARMTLFSDDSIQAGENILLTFTNIGKNVFPQASTAMLNLSQAMHQDLQSSAVQLGKALNDPVQGITALQRVGVTFTQSQKDMIAHLVATGHTAQAQQVILAELNREFGNSAVSAGKTFGGQLQILQNRLDQTKEQIGTALLPILSGLASQVSSQVMPAISRFSDWFVGPGLAGIERFAQNISHSRPVLAGLGAILASVLIPALGALAVEVVTATWPFLAIGVAVAGLVAIFQHFYETNAGFRAFIDGFVGGLRQAWTVISANFIPAMHEVGSVIGGRVFPVLAQIAGWLGSVFRPVWQQLVQVWQGQIIPTWNLLVNSLRPAMPFFQGLAVLIGGVLLIAFSALIGIVTGVIRAFANLVGSLAIAFGGVVKIISGAVSLIGAIIAFVVDLLQGNWSKVGADALHMAQSLITIISGMWDVISGLFRAAAGVVWGLVSGFIEGVVGFFRTLFEKIVGHSIIPDLINGVVSFFAQLPGRVFGLLAGFVAGAVAQFLSFEARAIAVVVSLIAGLVAQFATMPGRALSAVAGLGGALAGFFGGLAGQALGWGAHIIENIAAGIASMIGSVIQQATNVAGAIAGILAHTKPKMGPMADDDQWMEHFGDNLAQGLQKQVSKVGRSALTVALAVSGVMPGSPSGNPNAAQLSPGVLVSSAEPASGGIQVVIQPQTAEFTIDGNRFMRMMMPYFVQTVRSATGVRHL